MKPEEYSRGEALRVFWVDSTQTAGWLYDDEPPVPVEHVVTLGFFVNSSVEGVSITSSLSSRGGILSLTTIPWAAIQSIQQLSDLGWTPLCRLIAVC